MSSGDQISSLVWGNGSYPITQEFGVYNAANAQAYAYAASLGWPAGTHVGLDVGVPRGTPIFAAEPGEVIQSGPSHYFRPNPVYVKEDDGDIAIYGHLWQDYVSTGERVDSGDALGLSGEQTKDDGTMTPDGSGPHIHFELRRGDKAINPKEELTGAEGSLHPKDSTGNKLALIGAAVVIGFVAFKMVHRS